MTVIIVSAAGGAPVDYSGHFFTFGRGVAGAGAGPKWSQEPDLVSLGAGCGAGEEAGPGQASLGKY